MCLWPSLSLATAALNSAELTPHHVYCTWCSRIPIYLVTTEDTLAPSLYDSILVDPEKRVKSHG